MYFVVVVVVAGYSPTLSKPEDQSSSWYRRAS